jgi:catechol 2,3-dioxygenase-like lactoylglutathione lyase family enzyme
LTETTLECPNVRQAVPFLGVSSLEASLGFYVDGLGFTIGERWVHDGALRWCQLRLGGADLMLQEFWRDGPHEGRPAGALGLGVTICFICDDALGVFHEAHRRGLTAREPFVGNRMWVVTFADPDGYSIVFESPTSVPEDTKFSEFSTAAGSPP